MGPESTRRSAPPDVTDIVRLPKPTAGTSMYLDDVLRRRRSAREFATRAPLTTAQLSTLLWAMQGTTGDGPRCPTPSPGGLYPLAVYVAVGDVEDVAPGIYRYHPAGHELVCRHQGDVRGTLAVACLDQNWIRLAPALLAIAAARREARRTYAARAPRYIAMEVGCAAQNAALQATALGLGTALVGAFDDAAVHRLLRLPRDHQPMALLPVGKLPEA